MLFSRAEELLEKNGATPTIIQVVYPDPSGGNRKEFYMLRDKRVIELALGRGDSRSPWIVEGLAQVIWTGGALREKESISMTHLTL